MGSGRDRLGRYGTSETIISRPLAFKLERGAHDGRGELSRLEPERSTADREEFLAGLEESTARLGACPPEAATFKAGLDDRAVRLEERTAGREESKAGLEERAADPDRRRTRPPRPRLSPDAPSIGRIDVTGGLATL